MSERLAARSGDRAWFGHPKGLMVLFLTEMWEIFSFYGMRALLVYYMTKQLLMSQQQASMVYGLYTAFVYFTPIFGGAISDRWLGRRKVVILGGSIMAVGHFMMASEALLYPALAVIALGNGFFLPSLPSQIKGLYPPGDPRTGSAYSVYYVGINLGAFLAPLICGTLGELYGWHWGFGAAGIGMMIGLGVYILGRRHLPPEPSRAERLGAGAGGDRPPEGLLRRFLLLGGIAAAVVVFRIPYGQGGNTLALWIDQAVDRRVGLGELVIPATWFQSFDPLLVLLLTPILVTWWTRAAARKRDLSPLTKMVTGAALMAVAFLLLAGICALADGARVSWIWAALFILVFTTAELFILPVGLGLFGRLAPAGMGATTIALWFFASFLGNLLAGVIGTLWGVIGHELFFLLLAILAGGASSILLLFDRPARLIDHASRRDVGPDLVTIQQEASA